MKRNMDLVRKILLAMEDFPHGFAPSKFSIEGFDDEVVSFHTYLMMEAELITGIEVTYLGDSSPAAIPMSITGYGYEFLDAS